MYNRFSGLEQDKQIFEGAVKACKMLLEGMSEAELMTILVEAQAAMRELAMEAA